MDKDVKDASMKIIQANKWPWIIANLDGAFYKVFKSGAIRKASYEDVNRFRRGTPNG